MLHGSPHCLLDTVIRLGRTHKEQLTDDDAARSEGANQFKVTFDQLKQALSKNEWVKKNTLIAVAGGEKDGSSGLRDATACSTCKTTYVISAPGKRRHSSLTLGTIARMPV